MRYMGDDGARALAAAIIKQACIDLWKSAVPGKYKKKKGVSQKDYERHVRNCEYNRRAEKAECKSFLRSAWFDTLREGGIDGEVLAARIEYMRRRDIKPGFVDDAA